MIRSFQKKVKSEEGIALLSAIFLALFLSILIASVMLRSQIQLKETSMKQNAHHAFYAAEAGLDRAVSELRSDSAWRPGPAEQNVIIKVTNAGVNKTLGFYSLDVRDAPTYNGWKSVWIKSVGTDDLNRVNRIIIARVIIANPARFLVLTLGNLKIGSGANIDFDILAQDVDFEVNASLSSPDKDIDVNGDVYYLRSTSGSSDPAVHINPSKNLTKSPSITFSGVDVPRYRNLSQSMVATGDGYYEPGNLTLDLSNLSSLNPSFPGKTPQIVFADGDIHVKGDYPSSLIVVASGNIYIDADVTAVPDSTGVRPQIGLMSDNDVIIPDTVTTSGGNLSVEAFIMADGESDTSQGGFYAQGGKFSQGTLDFNGAVAVRGKGRSAIDMNVFKTRNYVFNSLLNSNRSIPFSPFIANIVTWSEASPADPFPPP